MPKTCFVVLAFFACCAGCNTETHLVQTNPDDIKVYIRAHPPKTHYHVLATITDVEDYVPPGGRAAVWFMKGNVMENLRRRAAVLGADGLILMQEEFTDPEMDKIGDAVGETTKIWLTALAIRFDQKPEPDKNSHEVHMLSDDPKS